MLLSITIVEIKLQKRKKNNFPIRLKKDEWGSYLIL